MSRQLRFALNGGVREETVGASLDTGGREVASELWNERVFFFFRENDGFSVKKKPQ